VSQFLDRADKPATPNPSDFSLMDPAVQSNPFAFYKAMHEKCPVYRLPENGIFVVSRYNDLDTALRDPLRFSNVLERSAVLQGENAKVFLNILKERGWEHIPTLQRSDPPQHTRYRRIIDRAFNVKQVRNLTPHLEEVARGLIDGFIDKGEINFIEAFAFPFPGRIIAELLGLEGKDWPRYRAWADNLLSYATRVMTVEQLKAAAEIELEMQHTFAGILEDRRKNPRDDLMTALVSAYEGEEPLTMHELQNVMHQLVSGGYETVPSALSHAVWHLIRFPEAQAKLRADRSLMRDFINESLRFESPVQGLYRTAKQDMEFGGTHIPKGSMCMMRYGAGNRDETQFAKADTFDLARENSNQHLGFGAGNHVCPGAVLARQELTVALNAILDRMDNLAVARPLPDPVHRPSVGFIPMKEFHLKFTKRA
jgi:cytochrome P450